MHDGVHETWVVERGAYPDVEENQEVNALLQGAITNNEKCLRPC